MFLLGVVLCLGVLLWRTDSSLEWSIPLKWQTFIETWQRRCGDKTHSLNYVCYLGSENSELEKDFWHLRMDLPKMQKKLRVPLWIKVRVHQSVATWQTERYLACLKRQFPEIEIYKCPLSRDTDETEGLANHGD